MCQRQNVSDKSWVSNEKFFPFEKTLVEILFSPSTFLTISILRILTIIFYLKQNFQFSNSKNIFIKNFSIFIKIIENLIRKVIKLVKSFKIRVKIVKIVFKKKT